jgi:glycosyltransferase involved in cell wall biosynthesis
MKYPYILFFRYDKYCAIDDYLNKNKEKFNCSIFILNNKDELNKLYDTNYHLLITFGDEETEYHKDVNDVIVDRMRGRWLHYKTLTDDNIDAFNNGVNFCYLNSCVMRKQEINRPIFSLFTTCYNSYQKIIRAYDSINKQTLCDWEWVILDDSPDDLHFVFLKEKLGEDKRIRLYKRSENNGNIGNVKNEVISLCRGKYVLEMDHDDEILPYVLSDAAQIFEKDLDVGFVYMDFTNIYEDGANYRYGDFYALGYSGYYRQKVRGNWVFVSMTPNINNITLNHIVGVPNHPRIWRRSTLMEMGNFCEYLPILDDYEVLIRSAVKTKIARIHKLGYIQYMNSNNNNFSLIRNSEINRIIWNLNRQCYENYDIDNVMKEKNAYEDENYRQNNSQIWKRKDYEYKYCNSLVNLNYKKQYCILGLHTFYNKLDELKKLYQDKTNDFLLLDNKEDSNRLCNILDEHNFSEMKCYSMTDCNESELIQYFKLLYKSCDDYVILYNIPEPKKVDMQESELPKNATKVEINVDTYTNNWTVNHF